MAMGALVHRLLALPDRPTGLETSWCRLERQQTKGTIRGIILPPGQFKWVIYNQLGATMAGSANTAKYRTYNRQII